MMSAARRSISSILQETTGHISKTCCGASSTRMTFCCGDRMSPCDFLHKPLPRRAALRIGGAGMLGLTLPRILRAAETQPARPAKAKSVVFLYQFGGPSHADTFDTKPQPPDALPSHFRQIASRLPRLP